MNRPLLLCAADLSHLPQVREMLENSFTVQYVKPTETALRRHLPKAEAYFASLHVRLTRELVDIAPALKVVVTPSTGMDHIDHEALQERNVPVLCIKDDRRLLEQITATAELAWALVLACARRLPAAVKAASCGRWARDEYRGHQLAGKTLGILGCGRLGSIVAQYGQAFRMSVIGCDRLPVNLPGVEQVTFHELMQRSDVLSIHIHLTPENRGLIGRAEFSRMKPGAILINTSRGAIIDEEALLDALRSGRLTAAGLDVIDGEWRHDLAQHPLVAYTQSHDNLIITPHIGGVTLESQAMAYAAAARKLIDFFRGMSVSDVDDHVSQPHIISRNKPLEIAHKRLSGRQMHKG